jgi:hypothetical protein
MKILKFISFIILFLSFATQIKMLTTITNCAELQNIRSDLNGSYVLANDIDCTNFNFSPINTTSYFTGSFDGKFHSIENLTFSSSSNYSSIFGTGIFATISNVVFRNLSITFSSSIYYVGLLFGNLLNSNINNILITANVGFSNIISGDSLYFCGGKIFYFYNFSLVEFHTKIQHPKKI